MRREPRFVSREKVELQVDGRNELKILWTENISKGGLFVLTEDPPPLRTRVAVTVTVPEGKITLTAEVVHILEPAQAAALNMNAGVGLQFVELKAKQEEAVARYLEGVVARLKAETADLPFVSGSEMMTKVQSVFTGIESNDLYAAISLSPEATNDQVAERLLEYRSVLQSSAKTLSPAQQSRLANAQKLLGRVSRVLGDPGRRLEYDMRTGRLRVDAVLQSRSGLEIRKMREDWNRTFPERFDLAKSRATDAIHHAEIGEFMAAVDLGEQAIKLDPFNRDLRAAVKEWRDKHKAGAGAKT